MGSMHTRTGRLAAGGVLVAIVITAGACGGGGSAISPKEFATKVNALCKAEHKEVDALFKDFPDEPSPERTQQLVVDFTPIIRQSRTRVMEIGAPSGKERQYQRYAELLDEALERYEAAGRDAAKAEALFNEDDTRMADAERDLGLDVCASR